jgi:hypothetical protein
MTNEADRTSGTRTGNAFTLVQAAGVMLGQPIEQVQQDEQVLVPFTEHNAAFIVPGDRARRVIIELEETGIEGTRISFLRLDSASLSADEDATPSSQVISANSERRSERTVVVGAAIGAVVGGVVIGILALILGGATAGVGGLLGGIALGGALGGLWAGFTRIGASDAWERSLHVDPDGYAAIGIHTDSEGAMARVRNVLDSQQVWLFDRNGGVLHRP